VVFVCFHCFAETKLLVGYLSVMLHYFFYFSSLGYYSVCYFLSCCVILHGMSISWQKLSPHP